MTINRITRDWVVSSALIQAMFSYSYTITSLYVMKHIDANDNALSGILFAVFGAIAAHIALRPVIRKFVLNHGVLIICITSLCDAGTELFLLVDPFVKLMGDVVFGAFTVQISQLLWMETKAVIYQNSNARVKFDLQLQKWSQYALVLGCSLVMVYEADTKVAMIISILANFVCIGTCVSRFLMTDNYIKENGLEYGIHEELNTST